MNYIEKIAVEWVNNDITTIERANDRITEINSYNNNWNKVARICGINSSGYPTKTQQENANRWINEWKKTLNWWNLWGCGKERRSWQIFRCSSQVNFANLAEI